MTHTIYGLILIDPESVPTPYTMMVSSNVETLEETRNIKVIDYKLLSIHEIPIYLVAKRSSTLESPFNTQCYGKNKDIFIMRFMMSNKDIKKNKLFGWNMTTKNEIKQVIIYITHNNDGDSQTYKDFVADLRTEDVFKDGLSQNPIMMDIYYPEGILNA